MRAKQCDRCGKLYTNTQHPTSFRMSKMSNTPSNYLKPQDLCEECEKDLERWFLEKDDRK